MSHDFQSIRHRRTRVELMQTWFVLRLFLSCSLRNSWDFDGRPRCCCNRSTHACPWIGNLELVDTWLCSILGRMGWKEVFEFWIRWWGRRMMAREGPPNVAKRWWELERWGQPWLLGWERFIKRWSFRDVGLVETKTGKVPKESSSFKATTTTTTFLDGEERRCYAYARYNLTFPSFFEVTFFSLLGRCLGEWPDTLECIYQFHYLAFL